MTRLTDDAIAAIRALPFDALAQCGHGWEPSMRLVGNVQAGDVAAIGEAVGALLAHADTLAAKLAEVERERDDRAAMIETIIAEPRDPLAAEVADLRTALEVTTNSRNANFAKVERMRPAFDLARRYFDAPSEPGRPDIGEVRAAFDRAARQLPAADVCPHRGGTGQVATMEAGCGAYVDCICAPGPGYESLASAIRALPDEEPPSGYVERAEVRRCEVAVVEAAERVVSYWRHLLDNDEACTGRLEAAIDELVAAREKAGGK